MRALHLRPGHREEAGLLSDLALRSKGHWGYDQAFLDACRAELTLTPEDIAAQRVTVAERGGQVVGFYALAGTPPTGTLEDLFVEPEHIGTGVGRALWSHAMDTARTLGFERLTLEADPGAEPFYLAMGARRCGSVPSGSIPGRLLPVLEIAVAAPSTTGHIAKGEPMTRRAVSSDRAPAALGPYSQAIVAGGFVFCSGTAGIDPATGTAADGIQAQTEQALQNLAAVLEAAGASMADLVKVTIFYADVDDFATLNAVYARHMPDPPPARSAPANVKLPHGLLISIDAIAVAPAG